MFPEKTRLLRIDVDLVAEMTVINPFDFFIEESAEHWPVQVRRNAAQDLAPYFQLRGSRPAAARVAGTGTAGTA